MLAHAPKGHLNYSNNPTYIEYGQSGSYTPLTGSEAYIEDKDILIKNTVSSSYLRHSASFDKQAYISRIALYDENRNLIGIAKLARPVKKTTDRDVTFKLKLDF